MSWHDVVIPPASRSDDSIPVRIPCSLNSRPSVVGRRPVTLPCGARRARTEFGRVEEQGRPAAATPGRPDRSSRRRVATRQRDPESAAGDKSVCSRPALTRPLAPDAGYAVPRIDGTQSPQVASHRSCCCPALCGHFRHRLESFRPASIAYWPVSNWHGPGGAMWCKQWHPDGGRHVRAARLLRSRASPPPGKVNTRYGGQHVQVTSRNNW